MPLSERLRLAFSHEPEGRGIRITGWEAAELAAFRASMPQVLVHASPEAVRDNLPPMAGRSELWGDALVFTPRYPLLPGRCYVVSLQLPGAQHPMLLGELAFEQEASGEPAARVVAVYPTGPHLPLNHLRFYVHFSHPMSVGHARSCIRLRDVATGAVLDDAFLDMDPELWAPGMTRLTLLLDPGRIKRGLAPHEEAGYPLVEGRTVVLEINPAFRDASGAPLAEPFTRKYHVGPAIRDRLDPAAWPITPPAAGSRTPLRIEFGRSFDHALALRCISIRRSNGEPLAGETCVLEGESVLEFVPTAAWQSGHYTVEVDPILEDTCGNSVLRPFDRDLDEQHLAPAVCSVGFEVA